MTAPTCGIDYSLRALHVAVVAGPTLVTARAYALGVDLASRIAVIQRALDDLTAMRDAPSVICMEQPWVREGRGIKTALDLHRIPHYVEALAAERGFTVKYVAVKTWRKDVLDNGGLTTDEAKEAAIRYVWRVFDGHEADDHNSADAICLAAYAASVEARRVRVG